MDFREMKNALLISIGLLFLLVMGLSVGGRGSVTIVERATGYVIVPVQSVLNSVGSTVSGGLEPFMNLFDNQAENERLKHENERLQSELKEMQLMVKEYDDLEALERALRFVRRLGIDTYVSADVVAKDTGNLYNLFVINAGTADGVTKNSTVINGDGLVGLVYESGDNYAKVVAIIDTKATVSFETLITPDHDGMLSGTGGDRMRGYLFDPNATINEGQTLVTSGLGILPKGIIVGTVESVDTDGDELLTQMYVKPAVDFHRVNHVMVIPYDEEKVISGEYIEN